MNKVLKFILLWTICLSATNVSAQRRISGTVSDDIDVIIGANVTERDKNNRIVNATVTDMQGNFNMMVKDPNNNLSVSFMGYKPWSQKIGNQSVFKIKLQDNTKQMKDVVVTAVKKKQSGGLEIPQREIAGATQTFKMDEMEGMAFESVDQALQGQIAGLDIVANSGNLGAGTTMRLRGTTTINGNAQPLIVVNDHIWELPDEAQNINFETMDNEEQFSTLLDVNPEDIESIEVLKDAATAAKWGAKGSNGVIEIKLRRGHRGPTNVTFSYKFSGTWQPDGYKMLDGDGYTMMLKEAYYNPQQIPTTIKELDYNTEYPYIYNHYSHNTDWLSAVKQFGQEHKFYVTLSGGGEKATFRVSAGYDYSTGSIIAQKMNRFTTQTALDYWVSDRIKFTSNIGLSFTTNYRNYGNDILSCAYKAMPNMSIYEYDAQGNLTGDYFNMLPMAATISGSSASRADNDGTKTSWELRDIFANGNPVAKAYSSWNKRYQYSLSPQFSLEYKILGKDDDHTRLDYVGDVAINVNNTSDDNYYPAGLVNMDWQFGGENSLSGIGGNKRNEVSNSEFKSLQFSTRHDLRFYPVFRNRDHRLSLLGRFECGSSTSNNQGTGLWNVPNGITDPTVVALMQNASVGNSESRHCAFFFQAHYSYKSKYSFTATVRTDGSSNFGKKKFGTFPSFGARWNVIDESWMKWARKVVSMFAIRPTYGITGNTVPGATQYNRYAQSGYYNGHTVIIPENISLTQVKWETTGQWNLGFNLNFLEDLITMEFELYDKTTTDMLMNNYRIASANGFSTLDYVNDGKMRNRGWELNIGTGWFAKVGKFAMKVRGNVAQNFNELLEMDASLLENLNGSETYQPTNLNYNQRVQIGNALGSIYGLRYKGVYRYDYDHNGYTTTSINAYGYSEVGETGRDANGNPVNTAAAAQRRGENYTCPIAYDANGNKITDKMGNPLPMYYCYNDGSKYQFQGGDAIYEDINHDGQIDRYDMVYLGNSNPKCSGGFGLTLKYGRFQLNAGFNFRIGNDIVNLARMTAESMLDNVNQSYATTWRWRKNGDITEIPRALNQSSFQSYNSLPSDRYVEKGDYLRLQYVQLSYDIDPKILKRIGVRQLKFYCSINNLFCWTKYTGCDPDIAVGGYGVSTDSSKTPRSKSFTASINLGF